MHLGQLPQCGHRAQQVDATDRETELVGALLHELPGGHRRLDQVVHENRLGDAVGVHLLEQLRQLDLVVERLRALEVVVAHLEHELGLLGGLTEVHVDEAINGSVRHVITCCTAALFAHR